MLVTSMAISSIHYECQAQALEISLLWKFKVSFWNHRWFLMNFPWKVFSFHSCPFQQRFRFPSERFWIVHCWSSLCIFDISYCFTIILTLIDMKCFRCKWLQSKGALNNANAKTTFWKLWSRPFCQIRTSEFQKFPILFAQNCSQVDAPKFRSFQNLSTLYSKNAQYQMPIRLSVMACFQFLIIRHVFTSFCTISINCFFFAN